MKIDKKFRRSVMITILKSVYKKYQKLIYFSIELFSVLIIDLILDDESL